MIARYDVCLAAMACPSTDARTLNMARTYSKHGFKTALIAADDGNCNFRKDNDFLDYYPIAIPKQGRMFYKWKSFVINSLDITKSIASNACIACDLWSLPIMSRLKKRNKGLLIYDSRELYSSLGPIAGMKLKQMLISLIENYYVKDVDKFIVSGPLDADYLKTYFGTKKPYSVILNVPPYQKAMHSTLIREKYKIPEEMTILLYQGAVLPGRGMTSALRALKELNNACLCIAGDGPFLKEIERISVELGIVNRVFILGSIPYNELHNWTCSADIGLALFEPVSLSYQLALPNKLFEYCMANIPTIATDLPAIRSIVSEHNIASLVPPTLPIVSIIDSINEFRQESIRNQIIHNCIQASTIFCHETQENEILSLVKNL